VLGRFESRHSTRRVGGKFAPEPPDESIRCNTSCTRFDVCFFSSICLYRPPSSPTLTDFTLRNSASVATIARIPYVHRLKDFDFFYANNQLLIWSIVEVGISIIATAAATLRPLLAKSCIFPLLTQRSTNRFGASRNEWSGFREGFGTSGSTGGEQRNRHTASGLFSQHTRVGSICEEGQKSNPSSSEEQALDWEVDQPNVTITAIESHLELEELDVPKCGIQKTVKISQTSLRE